jgi:hypothetical protein
MLLKWGYSGLRVVALALLLAQGVGCIIIPVPHSEMVLPGSRGMITPSHTAFVQLGSTTREEVLLQLGDPDYRWHDDRVIAYVSLSSNLSLLVATIRGGGVGEWPLFRFVLFEMDTAGHVVRVELKLEPPAEITYSAHASFVKELETSWPDSHATSNAGGQGGGP